jgi:hypothetical protein
MSTTRVIFTRAEGIKNFGAALIRHFDDVPFSHVGFLDGDNIIFEATMSHDVKMKTLDDFKKTGYPFVIGEVSNADYSLCRQKASELMGSGLKYDKGMITKMFVRRMPLLSVFSGKIQPSTHGRICSGLVAEVLQFGGVKIVKDFSMLKATPRDLYLDPAIVIVDGNERGLEIDKKYVDMQCQV